SSLHDFIFYLTEADQEELTGSATTFTAAITLPEERRSAPDGEIATGQTNKTITLYPNPVENSLNIQFSLEKEGNADIQIQDINGRTIAYLAKDKHYEAGTHAETYNLKPYSNGVYFLKLTSASGTETVRFVV